MTDIASLKALAEKAPAKPASVKRSKEMAIYDRPTVEIVAGKFVHLTRPDTVRVMARAEGYAMVRFKGAMPFAVSEKHLRALTALDDGRTGG